MQETRWDALLLPLVSRATTPSYYVPLNLKVHGSAASFPWIRVPSEGHGHGPRPCRQLLEPAPISEQTMIVADLSARHVKAAIRLQQQLLCVPLSKFCCTGWILCETLQLWQAKLAHLAMRLIMILIMIFFLSDILSLVPKNHERGQTRPATDCRAGFDSPRKETASVTWHGACAAAADF